MTPFSGSLALPGSKSYANRAIIAACLSQGRTLLTNATPCDDVVLMVRNLQAMGFALNWKDKERGELEIHGGMPKERKQGKTILDCENAGTTLRFLTSLACIVPGQWEITGNAHMRTRPIGDLVKALQSLGAQIEDVDGSPPVRITGAAMRGGDVLLDASKSSQYLSSLLLIGPLLHDGLRLSLSSTLASPSYIDLTVSIMNTFGVQVSRDQKTELKNTYCVQSNKYASVDTLMIEGDWSAAGAWLVLSALSGSRLDYTNVDPKSLHGDRALVDGLKALMEPGDFTLDCSDLPDQVMNIALFAAFRQGTTTIVGAKNLRLKECDRLRVTTQEFSKVGIDITEHDDGLIIRGRKPHTKGLVLLDPFDDHRMAMAFGILGSLVPGIQIKNPDCVSKSYPSFFHDLERIKARSKPIAIVGMRGAGKSSLARRVGSLAHRRVVDTDHEIRSLHGQIDVFVQQKGWPAFRFEEEKVVAAHLKPGCVLALGGGAIESQSTRDLLKQKAVTIWVQMSEKGSIQRLRETKRPPLTDLPLEEEVRQVLVKRNPLYNDVATIAVPEDIPFSRQPQFVLAELRAFMASYDVHTRRFLYRMTETVRR